MIVLQGRVHNHLIRISCTDTRHTICCRQDAIPRYNAIYATQQECQDACTNQVVGCNAINYAPADVGKRCVLFGGLFEDQMVLLFMISNPNKRSLVCITVGYKRANVNFYFVAGITNSSRGNISMP